jgi:hypothetical protein
MSWGEARDECVSSCEWASLPLGLSVPTWRVLFVSTCVDSETLEYMTWTL